MENEKQKKRENGDPITNKKQAVENGPPKKTKQNNQNKEINKKK